MMLPRQLTILGVGLLGGSIGLSLRSVAPDCKIVGYGHRKSTLDAALACGAIDVAVDDAGKAVRDADLVILCTPVGLLEEYLGKIASALPPDCLVTDVGSTKRSVVAAGKRLLGGGKFIGSHPIAGSEKRGIEYARADLFRNALCIITPTTEDLRTTPQAVDRVEEFWKLLQMRTMRLDADVHDRLLADVSHLPHVLAAALVSIQTQQGISLCGKGFIDTTRIASGDGGLWRDILVDNADNLRKSIKRLKGQLTQLDAMLKSENGEQLRAWLEAAAQTRQKLVEQKLKELE